MTKFTYIKSAQFYCHEQNHYNTLNTYIKTKYQSSLFLSSPMQWDPFLRICTSRFL